jgi:hypothetical protein|tara:strand:+ start:530 stop:1165 length:636 start_codon:yes stop_codon:yes gene_type:complete
MNRALVSLIALSLSLVASQTIAAQFYRWVDAQGNMFIQGYIPPESVAGGYQIIDDTGMVLKTVAPQISAAERDAANSAQLSAERQRNRDQELLKLYRSPKDVDRAMKTWLSRMDMEAGLKRNRIRIKENEYDGIQERAANQERVGQAVAPELIAQLDAIRSEIAQFQVDISAVEVRQQESRAVFMLDRDRMVTLWEAINKQAWQDSPTNQP